MATMQEHFQHDSVPICAFPFLQLDKSSDDLFQSHQWYVRKEGRVAQRQFFLR